MYLREVFSHFTTRVPDICGWKVQVILYSPGSSGAAKITVSPEGTSTSKPPLSLAVTVCGALSVLVTAIIAPGHTEVGTSNANFLMVMAASHAAEAGAGAEAMAVDDEETPCALQPVIPAKATVAITAMTRLMVLMRHPFALGTSSARPDGTRSSGATPHSIRSPGPEGLLTFTPEHPYCRGASISCPRSENPERSCFSSSREKVLVR